MPMTVAEMLRFGFEEMRPALCPNRKAVLGSHSTVAGIDFLMTPVPASQ